MIVASGDLEQQKKLSKMISSFVITHRGNEDASKFAERVKSLHETHSDILVDSDKETREALLAKGIDYVAVLNECECYHTSPFVHEHVMMLDDGETLSDVIGDIQDYAKDVLKEDITGTVSAFAPEHALGFVSLDMSSTEDLKKAPKPLGSFEK